MGGGGGGGVKKKSPRGGGGGGGGVLLEHRFVLRRTIILNWSFERLEMWVGVGDSN